VLGTLKDNCPSFGESKGYEPVTCDLQKNAKESVWREFEVMAGNGSLLNYLIPTTDWV
jgi:hypothetical protein